MRILYVVSRLDNTGLINQVYNLVLSLNTKENEVHIMVLFQENGNSRKKDFEDLNVCIHYLNISKKSLFITGIKKVMIIFDSIRPDIIHSEGLPADLITCLTKKNLNWVSTIHNNMYVDYPLMFGNWMAPIWIKLHEMCIKNMDKVICCSESISKIYSEHKFKVSYIQNGVDTKIYKLDTKKNKYELRSELGLDSEKKIITVVGSLDERKRTTFIIDSLGEFTNINDIIILFLGKGPLEETCRRIAQNYNIVFMGQVESVIPYLHCADIYLSASASEGLPMSVIEAGCCGLPMILSDIPQHKELSVNKTIEGLEYFKLDDKQGLVEQIEKMMSNKKINCELIARHYETHFAAKEMAKKYIEQYCLLVKRE